ncbi:hypothetical protein CTEN210_04136 [Chaetoceros tenuissimus]|uniref:Uncharacterized protein n=1 Tax=Chaetoceros tenuissimus TaxID=426638 RepID=A0AAD3CMJ0_9STRA|nr:hypothetical protein CTEN210_04136 [Chaetoceros tenuissimus]
MTFAIAVRRGNFPLLDYLIRNECPIDSNACLFAMKLEDESMVLRLFNWLCRHNCPWHEKTINSAAKKGHLVVLNHFKQNGYGPFDASVSVSALNNKDHSKALHTLKWLLEQSFPLHEDLCNQAFSKKNFEAMIWAAENGCRFRLRIEIDSFLQYLRLDVIDSFLQHFHDEFVLEDLIWSLFYHNKNSDILIIEKCKLLRKYYGWDSKFSIEAAGNGNIKVLQWLMQNRCPGDAMVCTNAVRKGDFKMLKCAHELGCDLAKEAYAFCLIDGGLEVEVDAIPTEPRESHVEIFNYLKQHNCPRPQDNHWYLRT